MKKTFFVLPMLLAMLISMFFVSCSSDDDGPKWHIKYDIPLPGTTWLTWGNYDDAYNRDADYLLFFNFDYDGTAQTISYERVGESDYFKKESSVKEWSIRAADVPFMKYEGCTVDGYVYNIFADHENYDYIGVSESSRKGYDYELVWGKLGRELSYRRNVIKVNSLPTSDYIDYKGDNYVFNNNGGGGGSTSGYTLYKTVRALVLTEVRDNVTETSYETVGIYKKSGSSDYYLKLGTNLYKPLSRAKSLKHDWVDISDYNYFTIKSTSSTSVKYWYYVDL